MATSKGRRGFHKLAPALLRAGWLPMPLPAGKKKSPPSGMTGGTPSALALAADPAAWAEELRDYLENDAHAMGNTGIRLPNNVFALDVDEYVNEKGVVKDGWKALAAFAESCGLRPPSKSLPKTIRLTARGYAGKSGQRFYRLPDGVDFAKTMDALPGEAVKGVEILRPKHRYTLAAGSLHPDGDIYRLYDERLEKGRRELRNGFASLSPNDLPEIPSEWLSALIATRPALLSSDGGLGDEARALAAEQLEEWIEENDLGADDISREQSLTLLTPGARRCVLAFGEPERNNSNVPTACISLLATLMEDTGGGTEPQPIRAAIDIAQAMYVRNGSQRDRPREFDRAMAWAFPVAVRAVASSGGYTLENVERTIDDDFWNQTDVLRSCREFARSRLVSPDAMLACALVIVASWLPPHLVLPGLVGDVAGLNMYVAAAAASGGGKSAAMKAAKAWLQVKPHEDSDLSTDEPYVTTVSTAQGLIQSYTVTQPRARNEQKRPGEMDHIQIRRSVRFDIDEIGALGAAMSAEGSMLKDFIKTMWTGSGVGTTAAEVTRVRKLEDHEYRMSIIAGVQPATADVILSGHGDGFPQRWLWVEVYDESPLGLDEWREQRENPPEPLGWTPPLAARPLDLPQTAEEEDRKKLTRAFKRPASGTDRYRIVGITESFEIKVHQAAAGSSRRIGDTDVELADVLDGHSVLLQEKLAALVAALHGEIDITPQYEQIAEHMTAKSDATRAAILRERHQESMRELEAQAKRQGRSEALAAESRVESESERAADRIMAELAENDGAMPIGKLRRLLPVGLAAGKAEQRAFLAGIRGLVVEGDTVRIDLG